MNPNAATSPVAGETRREFLKHSIVATATFASVDVLTAAAADQNSSPNKTSSLPWSRRPSRWGKTNTTEIAPSRYDIAWWRQHWKRTNVQGVIINAGGIVAYYPSQYPLHYRPARLGH